MRVATVSEVLVPKLRVSIPNIELLNIHLTSRLLSSNKQCRLVDNQSLVFVFVILWMQGIVDLVLSILAMLGR